MKYHRTSHRSQVEAHELPSAAHWESVRAHWWQNLNPDKANECSRLAANYYSRLNDHLQEQLS